MSEQHTGTVEGSRQTFLDALDGLSSAFASAREDVRRREAALKRALDELTCVVGTPRNQHATGFRDDNPLRQAVRGADEKFSARLNHWRGEVENYERNTEFREDFGDSLLVYVYGKVKAGKSSLGNYIAYGCGDPNAEVIAAARVNGHAPTFFLHDDAARGDRQQAKKNLMDQGKFAVGARETTTAIQGFRLPGLTWIDSPGLHSVTPENGELARNYANAADLILFPMNSAQPGRASDLEEIASLLQKRKPFLVILTRCDVIDEDADDEGNIIRILMMKSDQNRQDQIDYVKQKILDLAQKETRNLLDDDVLTISVSYAEEHADNPVELRASGLSSLFAKLTDLTQSQGVRLKQETPLNNLRAFVDKVLTGDPELSVDAVRADLNSLENHLKQQRAQLVRQQTAVIGSVLRDLDPAIERAVDQQRKQRDMEALKRECNKLIHSIVLQHVTQAIAEILSDTQKSLNTAVRFEELKGFPEFRDLTEEFELSNKGKGRAVGGGAGGVIGGLLGSLLGPVGIAAGAALGSWLGAKAGEHVTDPTIVRVNLGDNAHEVKNEAIRIAVEAAKEGVRLSFLQVENDFLIPIESRVNDIRAAIKRFEDTLKQEVCPQ